MQGIKRRRDSGVARSRKYVYGITDLEYRALLEKQHGKCAVCGNGETQMGNGGKVRNLGVDHCHDTGKIRGLLCHNCNVAIGHAQDDPALLRRMAAYLEVADTGHRTKPTAKVNAIDLLDEIINS